MIFGDITVYITKETFLKICMISEVNASELFGNLVSLLILDNSPVLKRLNTTHFSLSFTLIAVR